MKKTSLFAIVAISAASAHAGLLYEPSNYAAQDNLVVNLDGIRNSGPLKAHDTSADEWKNIGRVANDAEFFAKDGDTSAWVADGYHFAGGAYGKLRFKQNLGNAMTVQIVADAKGSDNTTKWPSFFGCPEDWANIYYSDKSGEVLHFKADAITGLSWNTGRAALSGWGGRYLNAALNSSEHKQILVQSDSFATGWKEGPGGSQSAPGSKSWTFGSCGNSQGDLDDRYLVGTIKAIRVYNKILSNTELAANRVIDEARFFTGIPVTNVVVATAVAGLEGNEGGIFAIDDDGYTFTAPQKVTKDGVVYSCAGYTLETWNGSVWSAPVSSASCSYTATDTSAKVRLTWQWQRAHAEVPVALDPLFDDYVTNGLILHLDGIRNVGADKPHSWTSPQWIDLVKGNIASFQHDEGDASTWLDDGYYFGGRSFAQFVNALSGLTNTVTVQVVCDTTTNALLKLKTSANPNVLWPNLIGTGDNDILNIYYDMNQYHDALTSKNATGGNVAIPKGTWEGRYATAIRNGNKNYITQTASIADAGQANAINSVISNNTVRIGSAGGTLGRRRERWFLGTIKAVRVYNRVLSDEELAQNRAIDEARFFGAPLPVTNVVVASSMRGVEGNEPEGAYALPAGGHTFSAPASVTVGEDSYSCTGYTLETWDGSAWSAPVSYGTCSYSATDTTALMRLTWQWTHTAGPGYDAAFSDYVTDGLVLHLDGIRNAGAQPAHDSSAKQWADLANKGGAALFAEGADKSEWKDDGYFFGGATYAKMNDTRTLDGPFTVQEVLDFDPNASHRITSVSWAMLVGTTDFADRLSIYYNQNNYNSPPVNIKVMNVNSGINLQNWDGEYATALYTGSQIALFQTDTPTSYNSFSQVPGTRTFTFGSGEGVTTDKRYSDRFLTGEIKSVRIYDRALTDAELQQNRAADEVRFFGRSPAATGDLVVASDVEGLSGDQPNGAYRPAAGYAFTAPAEAVAGGITYTCSGYTLETWDGSAWGSAVSYESCSYTADVSSASKRLTWNWRVTSRITKVQDAFDVGDYVQGDLYIHLDGIRNAGANAAHDNAATSWVNLGTGGASLNAVFNDATGGASGGWADDGYNFVNGGKFAQLASIPSSLNYYETIQIVCDVDSTATASYPTLFGSTNDYLNVYTFNGGKRLSFKVFNNRSESGSVKAGGRVEMAPQGSWNGQYANAMWLAGKYTVFQSVVPDASSWNGKWHYNYDWFNKQPFYIGGVYKDNDASYINQRRLTGKIQAVRIYTRALSDAELEWNRKVDEARFKGNPPDCNVVVVNDGGVCDPEPGNYKVDGTWTFTATTAPGENGALDVVRGYTIDTWNGSTWGRSQGGNGDTYTYTFTEGAEKIRLTWNSQPRAFTLIIR